MNTKAKLATILRRMADRLAPAAAAGDCGSGTTYVSFTADVPAGVATVWPTITATGSGNFVANHEFEQGEGWSPA